MAATPRPAGSRFIVLGRAGMDLVADPPGVKVAGAERFVAMLGGSSANIAAGLVTLGCTASLATTVSDDAVGHFVLGALDRHGIDRTHVHVVADGSRTSLALVDSRAVDTSSVIYRNQAADFAFDQSHVAAIDLARFDALVLTGTALAAEPSRSACMAAIAGARAAGLPVVLDVDYRPYSWASREQAGSTVIEAARLSDIVVGNDEEFDILALPGGDGLALAGELGSAPGRAAIYKMGPKGSVAFIAGERIDTGIYPVTPLKPTGAGDAFMAGLLSRLAGGADWAPAIRAGSAAAAIVVTRVGCAPAMPDRAELSAFMANHAPDHPKGG